jgi:hypothetical protein
MPFQVEIETLKQMRQIHDSITTPLEDLHLIVKTLDKAAALPIHKIVRHFIKLVSQRRQERVKTMQLAVTDSLNPPSDCSPAGLSCVMRLKN